MNKCSNCGAYNDIYEWPKEDMCYYKPNLCYSCYCEQRDSGLDEDEPDNSDPNAEYSVDTPIDPEDDDTPCLSEDQSEQQDNEEVEDEQEEPIDEEAESIRNIKKALFG